MVRSQDTRWVVSFAARYLKWPLVYTSPFILSIVYHVWLKRAIEIDNLTPGEKIVLRNETRWCDLNRSRYTQTLRSYIGPRRIGICSRPRVEIGLEDWECSNNEGYSERMYQRRRVLL